MIIFDTETTGLIENESLPLAQQPHIIEMGAIKVDDELKIVDELQMMIDPQIPLPPIITKITGLKDEDVGGKGTFSTHYQSMVDFFIGERAMVAHNLPFDRGMMVLELRRLEAQYKFPWPPTQVCTAELSIAHFGSRRKLQDIWRHINDGKDPEQKHRALDDAYMLLDVVRWFRTLDLI